MSDFASVLKEQITKRKQTRRAKRLLDLINGPKTKRRQRVLDRLEAFARKDLELKGVQFADWSEVSERDWNSFFDSLLKFIMAILPLILNLFA